MAADEEDFSFPTTTDIPPRFIGSPRLWRTASLASSSSSPASPHRTDDEENHAPSTSVRRKSLSEIGRREADGTEEKMDMLWEDFNEEFSRNLNSLSSIGHDPDHRSLSKFGCVGSLKLSTVPNRRRPPSLVVFVKVLKKMLMLHNSHRTTAHANTSQ